MSSPLDDYKAPRPKLRNGHTRPLWSWSVRLTFGKHKGKTLLEVEEDPEGRQYLDWLKTKVESQYLRDAIEHFLHSRKAARKRERAARRLESSGKPPWYMGPPKDAAVRLATPRVDSGLRDQPPFEPGLYFEGKPVARPSHSSPSASQASTQEG